MTDARAQTRLLAILAQLFSGKQLTAAAVAAQYHVSVRTAQRDLDSLQALRVAGGAALITRSHARPAVYQAVTAPLVTAFAKPGVGPRETIRFEYAGPIATLRAQCATARVVTLRVRSNRDEQPVTLVAMDITYSPGVRSWLIAQSAVLRVVSPQWVVADIKAYLRQALAAYEG